MIFATSIYRGCSIAMFDWGYPLVNSHITMERSTIFNGKIQYKWPFSIAMLVYQRLWWNDECENGTLPPPPDLGQSPWLHPARRRICRMGSTWFNPSLGGWGCLHILENPMKIPVMIAGENTCTKAIDWNYLMYWWFLQWAHFGVYPMAPFEKSGEQQCFSTS